MAAFLSLLTATVAMTSTADAAWIVPAPPTCHTGGKWHEVRSGSRMMPVYYSYAYRYTTKAYSSRGIAYTTHYVYDVQNVMYPYGMVTIGRADKICGQYVR